MIGRLAACRDHDAHANYVPAKSVENDASILKQDKSDNNSNEYNLKRGYNTSNNKSNHYSKPSKMTINNSVKSNEKK
jgi:hypothetical protein